MAQIIEPKKKSLQTEVAALVIGRKGSVGFPGKNTVKILGHALVEYPLLAAKKSKWVDRIYLSTDCLKLKKLGRKHGAIWIPRPRSLATPRALGEDAFRHGYRVIQQKLTSTDRRLEFLVLLFANAPTVSGEMIDRGIEALRRDPKADSAVSVSIYNMWSPLRARRLDTNGYLCPFVPFRVFGDPKKLNCDRDSQGNVYFADMGVSVVRPRCMEHMEKGLLPQKWMGRNILPIPSWGGCDVDYPWQLPQVEFWLKNQKKRTPA
jgi:CMP-N-acetylneuraminic acid synthetase